MKTWNQSVMLCQYDCECLLGTSIHRLYSSDTRREYMARITNGSFLIRYLHKNYP